MRKGRWSLYRDSPSLVLDVVGAQVIPRERKANRHNPTNGLVSVQSGYLHKSIQISHPL